jgi:hypothetical protein
MNRCVVFLTGIMSLLAKELNYTYIANNVVPA